MEKQKKKKYKEFEYVDTETGEIKIMRKPVISTKNEFVKLYPKEKKMLFSLTGKELTLLVCICELCSYNDCTLAITPEVRTKLLSLCETSKSNLANMFSSLVTKGLLFRPMRGVYRLNPKVIHKGDDAVRKKFITDQLQQI